MWSVFSHVFHKISVVASSSKQIFQICGGNTFGFLKFHLAKCKCFFEVIRFMSFGLFSLWNTCVKQNLALSIKHIYIYVKLSSHFSRGSNYLWKNCHFMGFDFWTLQMFVPAIFIYLSSTCTTVTLFIFLMFFMSISKGKLMI